MANNKVAGKGNVEDFGNQDLTTLIANLKIEGTNISKRNKPILSSLIARLTGEIETMMNGQKRVKEDGAYSGYDSDGIVEEDDSIREETKLMYEKNKDLRLMRDDMVRHIYKAVGMQDKKIERVENQIREELKTEIAEVQTKCDQNANKLVKTAEESLSKRIAAVEQDIRNVKVATNVLKGRVPSEGQKKMAANATKEVFLYNLQNVIQPSEERQRTVKNIAVEALTNLKCFKEENVQSTRLVGTNGTDHDKVELKDMKILVQFDTTEVRDAIIEEGSQRPPLRDSIRAGKTPDELKKGRMFYMCAKLCEEKNAKLPGEERKKGVYHPVLQPGSDTMFVPKIRDPQIIERKRKEYQERKARMQAMVR